MALVAYDNSDSSEYEEDENEITPAVILNRKVEPAIIERKNIVPEPTTSKPGSNGVQSEQKLFNLLPQPSNKEPAVTEEDDEFLHKKETATNVPKPRAKITVPSLGDFKDVEDKPTSKPKIANGKKSGLLSMLPQPRNAAMTTKTTSLIPNVLTKKPSAPLIPTSVKKKDPLPNPAKKIKTDKLISYSDESDNDDEGESTDFFSINKPELPPVEDGPLDIDIPAPADKTKAEKRGIESYFKKDVPQVELQSDYSQANETDSIEYYSNMQGGYSNGFEQPRSSGSADTVLDEEALRQLVGSRGKRKKEDIQIVDVNQQEVLGDARKWLLEGLKEDTSKRMSASKKKGNEPSAQQRRKHQITYLAHQAKAKEAELQNQWANNRMSKRQTQSKYGF